MGIFQQPTQADQFGQTLSDLSLLGGEDGGSQPGIKTVQSLGGIVGFEVLRGALLGLILGGKQDLFLRRQPRIFIGQGGQPIQHGFARKEQPLLQAFQRKWVFRFRTFQLGPTP